MNYLNLNRVRLIITEQCDLHCKYCYEAEKETNLTIDIKLAKNVLRKISNGSSILIFGGEPFLHIDLMKELIEWGSEYKNFRFQIATNGQTIDKEFFRDYCKMSHVHLSIDGPEYVHDLNRGKGSWKKAMEFLKIFQEETNKTPMIIPAYNKTALPYLFDIIKWHFNIRKNACCDVFVANTHELSEQDIEEFERQMELIKNWYINEKIYETRFSIYPFKIAENFLLKNSDSIRLYQKMDSCDEYHNRVININGDVGACQRQFWEFKNNNMKLYHRDQEDYDGVDYCTINRKDILKCRNCEVYGCKFCPTEWKVFGSKLYDPPEKWCKIWKIVIKKSNEYIEFYKKEINDELSKTRSC